MNGRLCCLSFLLAGLSWTGTISFSQPSTALRGAVTDPQGRPVAAARLTLFSTAASAPLRQVESVDGRFEFGGVSGGRYLIEAAADGCWRTAVPVDFQPGVTRPPAAP